MAMQLVRCFDRMHFLRNVDCGTCLGVKRYLSVLFPLLKSTFKRPGGVGLCRWLIELSNKLYSRLQIIYIRFYHIREVFDIGKK